MNRVVVTGMGLISSLGRNVEENWIHLTQKPAPVIASTGAASSRGLARALCLVAQAADEAFVSAGLWDGSQLTIAADRVGSTVSASKPLFVDDRAVVQAPDIVNDFLARRFGFTGEQRNVVAACATGAYSIAQAASWIEHGLCDVVLCGSVEPPPHPLIAAGFAQMGVLSADGLTKPFDAVRAGFGFGEGAGVVVLESEHHAQNRRAAALATLTGWGLGADGHSVIAFNSNGKKIANVIGRAITRAGLTPKQVTHVNAHGTATPLNDRIETQALQQAFGAHAPHLMISATKAATGHLLGAAGSVEFIFTVLALVHQFIPPTATLEHPDPDCALDYTAREGHRAQFAHALSLSFGFGGPIGALVVSR